MSRNVTIKQFVLRGLMFASMLLLGGGCIRSYLPKEISKKPIPIAQDISGTIWYYTKYKVGSDRRFAFIFLGTKAVVGNDTCNRFSKRIRLSGKGQIQFQGGITTLLYCQPSPIQPKEGLGRMVRYEYHGNVLHLYSRQNKRYSFYQPCSAPMKGHPIVGKKWTLVDIPNDRELFKVIQRRKRPVTFSVRKNRTFRVDYGICKNKYCDYFAGFIGASTSELCLYVTSSSSSAHRSIPEERKAIRTIRSGVSYHFVKGTLVLQHGGLTLHFKANP